LTGLPRLEEAAVAHFKDAILDRLAESANVAQFVSFGPGSAPLRYTRVHDWEPDAEDLSVEVALERLLERSGEGSVNIRSFLPDQPKSHDFLYGLTRADEAASALRRLAARGLHTIANETIDVNDGGVSGVSYADVLEFAPGDTPRCVEKPGTASFPRKPGLRLLQTVYGFRPDLDHDRSLRIEFSVHPLKRGYRHGHTIVWEEEQTEELNLPIDITWPNRFSRLLGDKAFGLLVADVVGLPVPAATVVARALAPFRFGQPTGSGEYWIRTCPAEQVPGRFTTARGWLDPFALLAKEDPEGNAIASVLAQEGVDATFSGALIATSDGRTVVEGVAGSGDRFMQGAVGPQPLPSEIVADVETTYAAAAEHLGPVRFEWVHDGSVVWIVQLHKGATAATARTIYPGEAAVEHRFPIERGLEALRALIDGLGPGEGVVLIGNVGVTSHFGDVLRRRQIPSRIEATETATAHA
jgi:hypothetical protein